MRASFSQTVCLFFTLSFVAAGFAFSNETHLPDTLPETNRVLRVAYHGNYMPVSFTDQSSHASGIMPDLLRWIADRYDFDVEFFSTTAGQAEDGVLSGKYDVMFGEAKMAGSRFLSTEEALSLPSFLFVPASSTAQTFHDGMTIAFENNRMALDQSGVQYNELFCDSLSEMVQAVDSGQADSLFCEELAFRYYCFSADRVDEFRSIGTALYTNQLCLIVSADREPLYVELSKAVAEAKTQGVIRWISREWLGGKLTTWGARIRRYSVYVIGGFGLLLAALLLFWFWDIRLTRRVHEKTEQLRNSEERHRTIFENSPDAILIEDESGLVLDANLQACVLHQLEAEELIGRNVLDLMPADRRESMAADLKKWVSGELHRREYLYSKGDGTDVPVEVIGEPLLYDGHQAVLLMLRDITENKKAEEAMKASERRYRGLVEVQNNFIVRTDVDGTFTFVNEAFCEFVGCKEVELIGQNIRSYVFSADIAIPSNVIEALVFGHERMVDVEHRMRVGNDVVWVQWECIAVSNESGEVVEIQSFGHDVTEHRQARVALQESERRLSFLFEEIPNIAVQGCNSRGEVIFWNHASVVLYGYEKKEALGKKLIDLVLPCAYRQEAEQDFDKCVRDGRAGRSGEMLKQRSDGSEVAVYSCQLVTVNPLGEREVYVVDVDLSELKHASEEVVRAKELAERSNRAKSEFLANMSHEIRTPMNGIMGMTQLMLETTLTSEQQENLQTIQDSAKELMVIIDELLDISRIEAGEIRLQPEPFDLRETVNKVVLLFADRAGRKGVKLDVAIAETVPEQLLGDSGRIRQILINLVGNSLKFTHTGYIRIGVSAERQENGWNLIASVADSGIGMAPDLQARIFDKFTQGDTSSLREFGGAGLGLAITRQLIYLMGGDIKVDSVLDQGTTFTFNLKLGCVEPVLSTTVAPEVVKTAEVLLIDADVLLVEDNLVNQKVAVAMLKKQGCRVTVASNGARALEQLALKKFDLIFMDCQMPVMDGFQATAAIREMAGDLAKIPIVAMTAHALKEDRQRCLDAGMDSYLSKPVRVAELIAILKTYCG